MNRWWNIWINTAEISKDFQGDISNKTPTAISKIKIHVGIPGKIIEEISEKNLRET